MSTRLELPAQWLGPLSEAVARHIEEQHRWVTRDGLARWLGCKPSHVYDLRQRGLPGHRLLNADGTRSKKLYFNLSEVTAWMERESMPE